MTTLPAITRCAKCHKVKRTPGRLCEKCVRSEHVKCARCKKLQSERDSIFCKRCGETFDREVEAARTGLSEDADELFMSIARNTRES